MNVANIGNANRYKYNVNSIKGDILPQKMDGNPKAVLDKDKIDDKFNLTHSPVDEKQKAYDSYRAEYTQGIIGDKKNNLLDMSLEDMYKYAMGQFDQIKNSTDNEETKAMRRSALEETLKGFVSGTTSSKLARTVKIDVLNFEKDKATQTEMRTFQADQFKSITNSVKKLTLNFLDFIKNNGGNDFEAMLNYVNKNSTNNRDINNLSTTEFSGFLDYAKNANYMHTQSYSDTDFYKGYFNTVSNSSADSAVNNKWESTVFANGIYQKYASAVNISV